MIGTESEEFPSFPQYRDRRCPLDPPPLYAELRKEQPITRVTLPSGEWAWLVTSQKHCQQLLADPRVSSDWTAPNFPFPVKNPREVMRVMSRYVKALLGVDPPEHTERRRMLISEFTVRRAQAMRPRIQQIVDTQIDAMLAAGQPADLVHFVSHPVPSLVFSELLGVPYTDSQFIKKRTVLLLSRYASSEERGQAVSDLIDYFDKLVTAKEAAPGDDLFGRLIIKNRETGVFTHDLLSGLMFLLLMGGYETTGEMISLGLVGLLQEPGQLAAIRTDPSLMPAAVEELLRFFNVGTASVRLATADIEIGGLVIKAGEGIQISMLAAARDPEVFEDPDRIDFSRGLHNHLAFGHGMHQCLGQNIARQELEIVFNTLFRRLPGLRLTAPMLELPYKEDSLIHGLHELKITWDTGA